MTCTLDTYWTLLICIRYLLLLTTYFSCPTAPHILRSVSVSSSRFQRIQNHLIPTSYEGHITKTVQGCWLNPRWTWRPSWSRLVTWRWSRFVHVQRGDVLINADYSVWDSHFRRPFTRISNLFKRKVSKSSSCESPHHFGPKGSISSLAKQSAFIPTFLKEEAGKLKRHQIDEWIHFLRLMNEYTSCFRFTD